MQMSTRAIREILLVEDNPGDVRALREMVKDQGLQDTILTHVASMSAAEKHLSERDVDIILLDLKLPDVNGLGTLRRAHAVAPGVPLVVLTGSDDVETATQALQEGAQEYLIKGHVESSGLQRALRYAIETKLMENALFIEKQRAEVTLSCVGDAVVCIDIDGNITSLNRVADRMTGWSSQEALGHPLRDVIRIRDATSLAIIENPADAIVAQSPGPHLRPRYILIQRDGSEIPIEDSTAPIHDCDGGLAGVVFAFRDVSAAAAMALEMTHSAEHDPLTGLPNGRLLHDRVDQSIVVARRDAKHVAVLYLDLDGFKRINDSLGHAIGDQLLQATAERLVACVRATDTVSRQGGDEFVILLSEVHSPDAAAIMANRLLHVVAEAHSIDARDLHVTTSVGVSVYPEDGQDAQTLIKNAGTAMYQAKENGRRSLQFFKPAMYARAVERQSIEEGLRRAVEREEFALHYQPKINLTTGAITGVEALLRWTHPTRGWLSPAQFIPVAEECGLIVPIGKWVLRQACKQARAWADAGLAAISMAVNVSTMEFGSEGFLEGLFAILKETGLDPRSLQLEITESVLMKHAEATAGLLQTLRAKGVQVAIDDFGTGYSSLSYLRRFEVDALKIDQSFVRQISTGGRDAAIVTAVIGMSRTLNLVVIAEGVETREELEFLRAQGCDEAQGYYLGRPVPAWQFGMLLDSGAEGIVLPDANVASDDRASLG
jgi:diguanylate cyclase (GGDEF)-like protein/PAS domain S-box-containing protein